MARKTKEKKPNMAFVSLRHLDYSPAILNVYRIKDIVEITKSKTEITYDSRVIPKVIVVEPKATILKKANEARKAIGDTDESFWNNQSIIQ